jgi:hypothetical protein
LQFSGGDQSQILNLQLFPGHNNAQAESLAIIGFALFVCTHISKFRISGKKNTNV